MLFPDAPAIAVNGAAREVKAIALYTHHAQRFTERGFDWIRHQRKFGDGFTTHSREPGADYLWTFDTGGGSAWGARKVAFWIGFDPVILCGCPLEPGPYTGNHGLGGMMYRDNVVDDLLRGIEEDTAWHEGCYSMSGRTRELLGE